MMDKETLLELSNISIFYQYLALGKNIIFNNGLTDLELFMNTQNDYLNICVRNLSYPELEPYSYTDMLTPGYILEIIRRLKQQPSDYSKECNKWDDIKAYTVMTISLNEFNMIKR